MLCMACSLSRAHRGCGDAGTRAAIHGSNLPKPAVTAESQLETEGHRTPAVAPRYMRMCENAPPATHIASFTFPTSGLLPLSSWTSDLLANDLVNVYGRPSDTTLVEFHLPRVSQGSREIALWQTCGLCGLG